MPDEPRVLGSALRSPGNNDDDTPLPLPLAAEPTRTGITDFKLPKLDPPLTPRQAILPGLESLPAIDDGATVPVPLLDDEPPQETPPPLPPSPASAAAEVWLEDAETRPSLTLMPDLAETTAAGLTSSGSFMAQTSPSMRPTVIPDFQIPQRSGRALLILSSATSFAVGLVLGALFLGGFGGGLGGGRKSAEPAAAAGQMTVCAPAEAPDGGP